MQSKWIHALAAVFLAATTLIKAEEAMKSPAPLLKERRGAQGRNFLRNSRDYKLIHAGAILLAELLQRYLERNRQAKRIGAGLRHVFILPDVDQLWGGS